MNKLNASKNGTGSFKLDLWPALDRRAWEAANQSGDLLDSSGAAAHWSSSTRASVEKAYGRLLSWLSSHGLLDPDLQPAARVTPDIVARYVADLRRRIEVISIAKYLDHISLAAKAMVPERDWGWLRRTVARLGRTAKPARNKRSRLVPSGELFAFGLQLMQEVEQSMKTGSWQQAIRYRDGLAIALLAARPLRQRNFCAIEIGRHLVRQGDGYWLRFEPNETKTRSAIEIPFPVLLLPHLDRYLTYYRPLLCRRIGTGSRVKDPGFRPAGNHLWVSAAGSAFDKSGFYRNLVTLTTAKFGHGINPHLFRDCAATTIATEDPEHVHITLSILGHTTLRTSERHYNHAQSHQATQRVQDLLLNLRRGYKQERGSSCLGTRGSPGNSRLKRHSSR